MMKPIYKLIMVTVLLPGTGIAGAGTQFGNYSHYIDAEGGSARNYLYAYRTCSEFPDGTGGLTVYIDDAVSLPCGNLANVVS